MYSKRAYTNSGSDDREHVRSKHRANNEQLRWLINKQLRMLNTSELSTTERLQNIITEQERCLEISVHNDIDDNENVQYGARGSIQTNYSPQLPDMGLN